MKTFAEEIVPEDILTEVLTGLKQPQKRLPSKLFYDKRGSELFDQICELDEYYPTRTEIKIMQDNIEEIGALLGEGTLLIELGSGSSVKIRLLLDYIPGLAGYIPIDISKKHLIESSEILKIDYPHIDIYPLVADYTKYFSIPPIKNSFDHKAVYYPGSTIGNFTREEAKEFLGRIAKIIGPNGGLVIGVDLKKDIKILETAYNDKKGITAEFNLNILNHINTDLKTKIDKNNFNHYAFFNQVFGRIEMHLVSNREQDIKINGLPVHFNKGEHIITEYSNKYTPEEFAELASDNFAVKKIWTDENNLFSVQYLRVK
ncbi:MAG TPA: L-histidine N(alpha)-methyltransferase [Ignavibacteriaceae bacterium]|nr:L-histidine N(alpha)-methyltransferase [Ignavibacteriaceae bacterium]